MGIVVRVRLLTDDTIDVPVECKWTGAQLESLIATRCGLRSPGDAAHFGLLVRDADAQPHWIPVDEDARLADCDPLRDQLAAAAVRGQCPVLLEQRVRLWPRTPLAFRHPDAVELLFLDALAQFRMGTLWLHPTDVIRAAAYVLQVYAGDFVDEDESSLWRRSVLRIPTLALRSLLAIDDDEEEAMGDGDGDVFGGGVGGTVQRVFEDRVCAQHRSLAGRTARGDAILNFLRLVWRAPALGCTVHRVRDNSGSGRSARLAVGAHGLLVLRASEIPCAPLEILHWHRLANLHYREQLFFVDLLGGDSSTTATAMSPGGGSSSRSWRCASRSAARQLWWSAVAQHQHFLSAISSSSSSSSTSARQKQQQRAVWYGAATPTKGDHHTAEAEEDEPIGTEEEEDEWNSATATTSSATYTAAATQGKGAVGLLSDKLTRLASRSSIASSQPSLSSLQSSWSSQSTSAGGGNLPGHLMAPVARVADCATSAGSSSNNMLAPSPLAVGKAVSADPSSSSLSSSPPLIPKTSEERARDSTRCAQLHAQRDELAERLKLLLSQLRTLCLDEAKVTGDLPQEFALTLAPGEQPPRVGRRVGTAFQLPAELVDHAAQEKDDSAVQLEAAIAVQKGIVAAAERMAADRKTNKSVRRKRQKDYVASVNKLRSLQLGLAQLKMSASKADVSIDEWGTVAGTKLTQSCPATPRGSVVDLRAQSSTSTVHASPSTTTNSSSSGVFTRSPSSCSHHRVVHQLLPHQASPSSSSTSSAAMVIAAAAAASTSSPHGRPTPISVQRCAVPPPPPPTTAPQLCTSMSLSAFPHYENLTGYRSTAAYQSAYRQEQYPTLRDARERVGRLANQRATSEGALVHRARQRVNQEPLLETEKTHSEQQNSGPQQLNGTTGTPTVAATITTATNGGFGDSSTASLDRRLLKLRRSEGGGGGGSVVGTPVSALRATSTATTTFPVNPLTSSSNRVVQPPQRSLLSGWPPSQHHLIGSSRSSSSASRLFTVAPAPADPRMEALLSFYKNSAGAGSAAAAAASQGTSASSASPPKTATIV